MPGRDRALRGLLGLVTLCAFGLRVWGLGAQSLWYDEGFSVDLASQGWRQILVGELNLPPLYHLILGGWVRLAGTSEFAARYLSALCGVLIVALGAVWAGLFLGRRAGVLAGLLLAVSPIEVWYAQEARMYALWGALTLGSTVALVYLMRGKGTRGLWVAYGLANVAALYTHYYAALALGAQAVWALAYAARSRDRAFASHWLLSQGALGLAMVGWLPVFWPQWRAANTTYWPGRLSWQFVVVETGLGFAGAGLTVPRTVGALLAGLGAVLAALGAVAGLGRARSRWGALALLAYVVVPLLIFYGLVHTRPKFSPRYLLPVVPALAALAAGGIAAILPPVAGRWPGVLRAGLAVLVGGALAGGSVYAATNPRRDSRFGRDDLRGAAAYLRGAVGGEEAVILLSGHLAPAFAYYYGGGNAYPIPARHTPSPSVDEIVTLDVLDELNRIIAGRRGVWLLLWQDDVVDPNGVVRTVLDLATTRAPVERSFRGLELRHYVFPPGTQLHREMISKVPLNVTVGQEEVVLLGCDLPTVPVPAGSAATVLLFWQALRPVASDYRLSLRVIDEYGQERAHLDRRLAAYMYPTDRWRPGVLVMGRHDVPLPPGLPPGEYALQARIYARENVEANQVVALGQFQVGRPARPPTLEKLGIRRPVEVAWGELELVGFDLAPMEAAPGQTVYLTLFWRAIERPAQRYRTVVSLGGQQWASLELPAAATSMQPGDAFQVQYPLRVPRDAPAGRQQVGVTLQDERGARLSGPAILAELSLSGQERLFGVPAGIRSGRRASLGGQVTFLGYDLESGSLAPGEVLRLTLYWQAVQAMDTSYTVFTHLLDGAEQIWGQVDRLPDQGRRPTTGWLPGEVVIDVYDIQVRPEAPPGQYVIEIGMYDAASGQRLAVRDEAGRRLPGDRILLEPVMVRPPVPPAARP